MHRQFRGLLAAAGIATAFGVTGCDEDSLAITNPNEPDVERLFLTPAGVETIVSKLLQQMHQGQYAGSDNLWTQSITMSFESHSQLGNFGMGTRAQIPRALIDNTIGNREEIGNFRDFDHLGRNARLAASAINALNAFEAENLLIGSNVPRQARAKSFAFFTRGFAHGFLSLLYDSAAIIPTGLADVDIPPLEGFAEVNAFAIEMLDSALTVATSPAGKDTVGGWPIPKSWVASPTADGPTIVRWREIIRSYRARFRAGVARTPAERAAVDWDKVIADATNGIKSDFAVQLDPSLGWTNSWIQQAQVSVAWHQMTPFIIGMADTTLAYESWLQTALMQRAPFLIRTPDRRFPSGQDRAAQQAKGGAARIPPDTVLFFRNRPTGQDTPAEPWGQSFYDNIRFGAIRAASGIGVFPIMTVAEVDMLAAEGYIRKGQFAQAAALIDKYRVQNGLPSVAGLSDLTTPVPGGAACVPRVPTSSGTSTTCGNIFEAMKWEKRMETAFTGYAQWFVDSRGWGDLVVGTPLEWPVPYQELFARERSSYTTSAVAVRGTYGF